MNRPREDSPRPDETKSRTAVTAIILAKNEAHQIRDAVLSVLWAQDILVVVDSSSTDGTASLAEGLASNVRVYVHEFVNFSYQRNWAIGKVTTPWVFMLDADERPSPELVASIRKTLAGQPDEDAFRIYRRNFILGRPLKYGGQARDKVIRLFRRGLRYPDRLVHEELTGYGRLGQLEGHLDHFTFTGWHQYMGKVNQYVILAGRQAMNEGASGGPAAILLRPVFRFLKQYVVRCGFLDGMPGLIYATLASYCVFLKYSVLWDLARRERTAGAQPGPSDRGLHSTIRSDQIVR